MKNKSSDNKDIYIMLVGMGVVLLAFISLFWTSQKSMVASVASILVMIIGIFIINLRQGKIIKKNVNVQSLSLNINHHQNIYVNLELIDMVVIVKNIH